MNIIIHPLSIFYILLSLIFDRFQTLFYLYLIGLIHELSHIFVGKILKIKCSEIILFPTGFMAKIDDINHLKIRYQLMIILAGPLSFFISNFIGFILLKYNIISIYGYREFNQLNFIVFIFNLLPCYPLDGGKLFDILIANIFNEYITRIIRITSSLIAILFLSFISESMGDYIFIGFLLIGLIASIINFKKEYFIFLIKRQFKKNKYKPKINRKLELYRYRENYLIDDDNQIINEKKIIEQLFINNSNRK